jgi:hypothetical protein
MEKCKPFSRHEDIRFLVKIGIQMTILANSSAVLFQAKPATARQVEFGLAFLQTIDGKPILNDEILREGLEQEYQNHGGNSVCRVENMAK